ncbi:peptidoglycan-binding protein [Roseicyclus sp. F158]|uniref:Peptidoglycan-binding protein n=1 Tax=Tropicimonas omnivorans TaxID=3075590 RepID=A0ABU3DHH1_9RHOB|nr:peptidoglycan-binding protein [Roseicyclus sp. F158]MDT0683168.1 peptidoglycan-binding protein [Roseicyclus sp. F158]
MTRNTPSRGRWPSLREALGRAGRWGAFGLLIGVAGGCGGPSPATAIRTMQPDAAPVRNITSFSQSLACMDRLLLARGGGRTTLSSSDIPDRTRKLPIGADDMLINAISQMNRSSGAYVFLDQTHVRGTGLNVIVAEDTKRGDPKPEYYIRGSISQLDRGVHEREAGFAAAPTELDETIGAVGVSGKRTLSVVTVDLHLVNYKTRQVLPGASVSNSMVVVGRSWKSGAAGLIKLRPFDLTLEFSSLESESQAVRNLIELGVIGLLGRHSGVDYQTCLTEGRTAPTPVAAVSSSGRATDTGPEPLALVAAPTPAVIASSSSAPPAPVATRAASRAPAATPAPAPPPVATPANVAVPPVIVRPEIVAAPKGPELRALQTGLVILGYLPQTSGRYDSATQTALAHFQSAEGLNANGLADSNTRSRLRRRLMSPGGDD